MPPADSPMTEHAPSPQWTEHERYWIGKIISEAGEFGQVAGNAQCFGIDTPDRGGRNARLCMEDELGDVVAAIRLGIRAGIFSGERILARAATKEHKLLDPHQRDHLGRRLAPAMPEEAVAGPDLITPTSRHAGSQMVAEDAPPETSAGEAKPPASDPPWAISPDVRDRVATLTKSGAISVDAILRRALKIELPTEIPQDGTVGYRDPSTGLTLPEGFAIERTYAGVTHRATATGGGFRSESGAWFENLNRLNRSLEVPRPENAWNEWFFVDATRRLRRLNSARPMVSPRRRKPGRRVDPAPPSETETT